MGCSGKPLGCLGWPPRGRRAAVTLLDRPNPRQPCPGLSHIRLTPCAVPSRTPHATSTCRAGDHGELRSAIGAERRACPKPPDPVARPTPAPAASPEHPPSRTPQSLTANPQLRPTRAHQAINGALAAAHPATRETFVVDKKFNVSWRFNIDPGFDYLLEYEKAEQRKFKIYINSKTAAENYDVFAKAGGKNKAFHEDFLDDASPQTDTLWCCS
nr:unnamed protein product [Digitaria exilis]